ncbi:isochorismatase family protein [Allokutzneria oryzae]|uniref:Isochorismatase family protein n=1 Tax=Allokutzneria oryzae TaxID=1378989 RepID=A0ABV5ZPG6_9PSEU
MAIPPIAPYPMPTERDLPQNRVTWQPDPSRAVLLIHDMQQYFLDPFPVNEPPVIELVANIGFLREQSAAMGVPVVYTAQPGGQTLEQRGLLQDFWGNGIPPGPDGQRVVDALAPREQDVLLTKWRYSAFVRTDLLERLRSAGRDQLVICGVYGHIGCLMTACDAFMHEIQPFFVGDAIGDFSLERHRMALEYAAQRCATTISTRAVVSGLLDARPAARIA